MGQVLHGSARTTAAVRRAIQQALVALTPAYLHEWYWNLLAALPCTCVIAAGSWWLVEKPVLSQRDKLKKLEVWYLGAFTKNP